MKQAVCFPKENILSGILFLISYAAAVGISQMGFPVAAGLVLLVTACVLYGYLFCQRRCPVDLTALLSLFWTGGLGLGIMRLSALHTPWTWRSILCFGGFYLCYLAGEGLSISRRKRRKTAYEKREKASGAQMDRLYRCILAVSVVSALVFWVEVGILGYIPILSEDTHAYNTFHVTGLHYFTVSCMMTHALTAIFWMEQKKTGYTLSGGRLKGLAATNLLSLSVAVMCISKLQFLLIVGLPVLLLLRFVQVKSFRELPWKKIGLVGGGLLALLAAVMVLFTFLRHYEPGYLNGIFEFRNPDTPIWIQYPYMYVANNFANFNCLTENLTGHTYGLRQLFPVFALTGTKFLFPSLVNFPLYVVKEEINTLTIIYDAYYDFGVIGVLGFGLLLGAVSGWITAKVERGGSMGAVLLYGQIAVYTVLSFFSAWYSVATTWFWFALTAGISLYVDGGARRKVKMEGKRQGRRR